MKIVTIHAAKTNLSQLLAEVEAGQEIVLARGKTPDREADALRSSGVERRKPGSLKGQIEVGPEFFEPLPEDELKVWE